MHGFDNQMSGATVERLFIVSPLRLSLFLVKQWTQSRLRTVLELLGVYYLQNNELFDTQTDQLHRSTHHQSYTNNEEDMDDYRCGAVIPKPHMVTFWRANFNPDMARDTGSIDSGSRNCSRKEEEKSRPKLQLEAFCTWKLSASPSLGMLTVEESPNMS